MLFIVCTVDNSAQRARNLTQIARPERYLYEGTHPPLFTAIHYRRASPSPLLSTGLIPTVPIGIVGNTNFYYLQNCLHLALLV